MAKRVQDKKPKRTKAVQTWIDEKLDAQVERYKAIVKEMDELAPTRAKWYEDFLKVVQTRGFNFHGENRRKIPKDEVPKKPNRKDRVVF